MVPLQLSIDLRVRKWSRDVLHRPQLQEPPQGFGQKARAVVSEQCRSRFHGYGRLSRKFHRLLDYLDDVTAPSCWAALSTQNHPGIVLQCADQIIIPPARNEEIAGIGFPLLAARGGLGMVLLAGWKTLHPGCFDQPSLLQQTVYRGLGDKASFDGY